MNKSYRTIFLLLVCAFLSIGNTLSLKGAEPRFADSVLEVVKPMAQGAAFAAGLFGLGALSKAAYLKYLLYSIPETCLDENPFKRKAGEPIKIYQWATQGLTFYKTPGDLVRAEKNKKTVGCVSKAFIEQCKNGTVALYNENGAIRSKIQEKEIIEAIRYEQKKLDHYMSKLRWFTQIDQVYFNLAKNYWEHMEQGNVVPELAFLDFACERNLFYDMDRYIARLGEPSNNWLNWLVDKTFFAFQQEVAQKHWDLFVARSRLQVLETMVTREKSRKEEEAEKRSNNIQQLRVNFNYGGRDE